MTSSSFSFLWPFLPPFHRSFFVTHTHTRTPGPQEQAQIAAVGVATCTSRGGCGLNACPLCLVCGAESLCPSNPVCFAVRTPPQLSGRTSCNEWMGWEGLVKQRCAVCPLPQQKESSLFIEFVRSRTTLIPALLLPPVLALHQPPNHWFGALVGKCGPPRRV